MNSSKPFKLCFKNEIHRISKLPSDYKTLLQNATLAFKSSLPSKWALQYEDSDGDRIMLTSDEDYKSMLECELDSSSKSVKIFLLPLEQLDMSTSQINNNVDVPRTESLEFSRILENQPQPEEVPQKVAEIPVEAAVEEIPVKIEEVVPAQVEISEIPTETQVTEEKEETKPSNYIDVAIDISHEPHFQARREHEHRRDCGRFREERKQRMRGMVTDVVLENIPVIAELVKDYLNNPNSFHEAVRMTKPQEEQVAPETTVRPVHYRVTCDGCGTNPIIGVRYKCAVCEDFDYCEKCESSVEHAHPFLKIKDPKHHPRAMITILEEDIPKMSQEDLRRNMNQRFSHFSQETRDTMSRAVDQISQQLFAPAPQKEETQPMEEVSSTIEDKEEAKVEEVKPVAVVEPEVIKPEVKEKEVVPETKKIVYPKKIQEKAMRVKEIFPDADLDHLMDIVDQSPLFTIEELVESYLASL